MLPFRRYLLACALLVLHSMAPAQTCAERVAALSQSWQREVPCHCEGETLARITLTLPSGLRLKAACGLRRHDGQFIDLRRSAVDMDRYDKNGNSVDGVFYISGTLVLDGEIRVEPSDGGNLFFIPRSSFGKEGTPLESWFRLLRIADADARKFAVSNRFLSGPCYSSTAKARFSDFTVSLGDTDSDGTFPSRVSVLGVGKYHPCVRE